jgi:protein ImuB
MNFAALWISNFSLAAVQRADPSLAGRPAALIAGEGRQAVVTQVSPQARRVLPGLSAPLAAARCPGLQLRERDPAAEVEVQRLLLAAAFALSPRVEATGPGCCTADLQGADAARTEAGMHRQIGELRRLGLSAGIGAGETPLVARYAARCAAPVLIVRERADFLRPLPIGFAEPTPAQAAVLQGWGIRTLGGLTALPKAEVGARLGAEGIALWERASGEGTPLLRLTEPARTFVAAWQYEPPVESLEPLLFKLRRFAERVAIELRSASLVAEALTLTLRLEDETDYYRQFRLPEPGADADSWLRVLQTHLDTVRLRERVAGVRLAAEPGRPAQRQDGLFDTGLADPHSFWENLARLAALVGDERVGTPVLLDSHAPDGFRLERPAVAVPAPEPPAVHPPRGGALRRFRPALPARVRCAEAGPVALDGAVRGEIRARTGPRLLQGDWWQPAAWAVETWEVELNGGGIYQLARDAGGWWIEGVLD